MATLHPAQLFDGQSAASHDVSVELRADGLVITDGTNRTRRWTYEGLEAATPYRSGEDLRLKHASEPSTRLTLKPGLAVGQILERARQVEGGFNPAKAIRFAGYVVAGLAIFALCGYAVLNLAPQKIAAMMPAEWRENLADSTEKNFIGDTKQCKGTAGTRALTELAGRVAAISSDTPDFSIRVFDMPFVNAFALPGGRIVLTGKLIKQADSAEEVAGVIAHEIGHTAHLHPEASLVRAIGLQLLINVATGGSNSDLGGFASLLAILQYSRNAEREADDYAVNLLTEGSIDPKGLRRFFEKLNKKEFKLLTGKWETLSNMLSTHPGTEDRIEFIKPLPPGQAKQVIPPESWRDLKKICS